MCIYKDEEKQMPAVVQHAGPAAGMAVAGREVRLDAEGLESGELNALVRRCIAEGATDVDIRNICGHRYLADALDTPVATPVATPEGAPVRITLHGTPGQNLGAFMRGPRILVRGNAQDGVGNTMDDGEIRIDGHAGDVLGYAMRGGRILIRGDVGYRVGIHMKAYAERLPVIVIGGKAGAFLGEYMAGGVIILLGLDTQYPAAPLAGRRLGTGMHGGRILVRGQVPPELLGDGLLMDRADGDDQALIETQVRAWAEIFGHDADSALAVPFSRIRPASGRPYGNLYTGMD